jgi:hypothetical protein
MESAVSTGNIGNIEKRFKGGRSARWLLRIISFAALGACLFINPLKIMSPYYIGFGILTGIIFGTLYKGFLKWLLVIMNGNVRSEFGRGAIPYVVESSMMYIIPFAVMALVAAFGLKWSVANVFFSTGIMAVGTASSFEMGKLQDKRSVKNTIVAAMVSFAFSAVLTMSMPYLAKAPGMLEGVSGLVASLIGKGGSL